MRTRIFTDSHFRKAARTTRSKYELANKLNCSIQTIINYAKCLNIQLDSTVSATSSLALDIYAQYTSHVTIKELAKHFKKSKQTIRYHLEREMSRRLYDKYPRPRKLSEIKVVQMLEKDEALFFDLKLLAESVKLPLATVNGYLQYCYDKLGQRPKRKGRRAKR